MPKPNRPDYSFKPRARLLLLLGDELIRDPAIAVFELVKNAYDADSPFARVTMRNLTDPVLASITIEDAGTGMDLDTLVKHWLEPGTDYRFSQRAKGKRTLRYGRLPLGEKGVGRFAAHKLGKHIRLETRRKAAQEIAVDIDWTDFERNEYLSDVPIRVLERKPEVFRGNKTGTRIHITAIRHSWTRAMARSVHRAVTSISSPFVGSDDFKTEILFPDNEDWLEGLMTVNQVLEYSLFRAKCRLEGDSLSYRYSFHPFPAMNRVKKRTASVPSSGKMRLRSDKTITDLSKYEIGPVSMDLYIFDRDPKVLALGVSDKRGLREFLDTSGGIRVYRDGIRVYDYGEPGNDWLNLGGRRVNVPTRRISNNLVVGAVSLDLERSRDLVEKTNREGFVENDACIAFRDAVSFAVDQVAQERNKDKKRIRDAYAGREAKEPVLEDLAELREIIDRKGLTTELGPILLRIERDYTVIRDRFLTSASAGLSLTVVIHEVEKLIAELRLAVKAESSSPRLKHLTQHLADLVEGFAALARRSGTSIETASDLISMALFNTDYRLKVHSITVTVDSHRADFQANCSRRLVISTLMNLIDNSIWWLDSKWADAKQKKHLFIGTTRDIDGGPAIVVADNGPGFLDPPEYLIQPFISRKPDGMGLGLHIADQVMLAQGGKIVFPSRGDLSLPDGFDGAVVALVFKEEAK
jgi:signal transduction histidine kinase